MDVGQGDGIYIHTSDGADVFIDGGSMDVRQVGTYRILPFLKAKGITTIHSWFISHLDQDHTSGFLQLIDSGFPVQKVVLAKGVLQDEAYQTFLAKIKRHHLKIQYLQKADVLRGGRARFTCLGPSADETAAGRNERSLVLLYEDQGFSGFFPGDISVKEEQKLITGSGLAQVTFYKAAHHGSNYSNSREMLRALRPSVSAVSCARDNDYGHPGPEALANMQENSQAVYQTMQAGRIKILWQKGQIMVQEYCEHSLRPAEQPPFY